MPANDLDDLLTTLSEIEEDDSVIDIDIESISIPVDEEADPVLDDKKDDNENTDYWATTYPLVAENYNYVPSTDYTNGIKTNENKKCSIYVTKNKENGSLFVTANVFGVISDINDYIELIDMLTILSSSDTICIFIDSPGGMVATGAHIASLIDICKGKVITIAWGFCASAGSLIWSSGHECYCSDFAVFMYHMSSHGDYGNSYAIMTRAASMVEYVKTSLLKIAFDKGHITEQELENISKDSTEAVFIDAKTMMDRISAKRSIENV